MHIHLEDQENGATLVVCVERATQTCMVLKGDESLLQRALQLAASLKVPSLRIIVHSDAVASFKQQGWQETDFVLMEQRFNNGRGKSYEQTPESVVRELPAGK